MLNVTKNNLCLAVFSLTLCNLKPSKVYSWLKPPVVWLILLGYWLVIAEFMYLERYRLRTMEYKMKLAGTPQWAIGIQYSQAWIGFNVTGFTIIPNNIQPSVSFFVNINLADKDQRWFLYEFINIKRFIYSKCEASYFLQSCITEQKPIPISWLVFVALETVESWELAWVSLPILTCRCCNKVFTASSHEIGTWLTHSSLV